MRTNRMYTVSGCLLIPGGMGIGGQVCTCGAVLAAGRARLVLVRVPCARARRSRPARTAAAHGAQHTGVWRDREKGQ